LFGVTFVLVRVGLGSLLLLLLLTAGVCIILGMGMPTTAIYLIVATLAAPPLRQLGVSPIAADMFVLYFGLLSMITPPVALAAFAAANLAGARPMKVAVTAVRYGWPAFILPFLFVLSPSLLLQGSLSETALAAGSAVAGVWLASVGIGGYFRGTLSVVVRLAFALAGLALLVPASGFEGGVWLNAGGLALAAVVMLWRIYGPTRRQAA
jgi:TRAP-type uncharacterized transport system fused permease subunit